MITITLKEQLLAEKVKKFYNDSFSQKAKDLENEDELLDYCLSKAWVDATQRERFKGRQNSDIIQNKDNIIKALKAEIKEQQFLAAYDTWHNKVCSQKIHGMKYGIWQKFINMTFKYMYCVKEKLPSYKIDFTQCHCPIDSIIAQRADTLCIVLDMTESKTGSTCISSIAKSGSTNWNNLEEGDYEKVKKVIQDIARKCQITPLEFDFLFW